MKKSPRKKAVAVAKRASASPEDALFARVVDIIRVARGHVTRSVNTAMVQAYWLIGREIVEVEQHGEKRAGYGERLVEGLAKRLTARVGKGFSVPNLRNMRQFYLTYRDGSALPEAVAGSVNRSALPSGSAPTKIRSAVPSESRGSTRTAALRIGIVLCSEKNDAMAKITLPENNEQILAARYQMYLPTEEELRAELAREREAAERALRLAANVRGPGRGEG